MIDRDKEHLNFLEKQSKDNSVLWLHSLFHHQGRLDIQYTMVCTAEVGCWGKEIRRL